MKNKQLLNLTRTALVGAVAIVLSVVEMLIPTLPFMVPGIKLGLSNIATMFALYILNLPAAIFVCILKAMVALFMRGFTAFFMSLAGGLLSTFMMFLLIKIKKPRFGYLGIGILGAFSHNMGQLFVAFLLTDRTIIAYLPVLSISSLVTGSITALALSLIIPAILKISIFSDISIDKGLS